jgi:uncharacterized membrane protein YidH (DUF202 family)
MQIDPRSPRPLFAGPPVWALVTVLLLVVLLAVVLLLLYQ